MHNKTDIGAKLANCVLFLFVFYKKFRQTEKNDFFMVNGEHLEGKIDTAKKSALWGTRKGWGWGVKP